MSKQDKTKKRKTRLKGTETHKPCADCGQLKDRFKAFKPRWAGCVRHKTDKGRRYHQKGCADCDAKVNGNIRQPRCIECDAARPKKRKKAAKAEPTLTPTPVAAVEPKPEPVVVEPEPEPEPVVVEPEPEPEPVVETVEAKAEPSPTSEDVTPTPAPAPKKKLASMSDLMADLSGLFGEGA